MLMINFVAVVTFNIIYTLRYHLVSMTTHQYQIVTSHFCITREISGFIYLRRISPISRLSLPNLRIIRGNIRFTISSNEYSLIVANSDIGTLYMPQLREITQGGVFLRGLSNTPSLCNVQNVSWTDIISFPSASIYIRTTGCTNNGKLCYLL